MTIPAYVEFWKFNWSLVGINGNTLVSADAQEHFVAGKIGQAWDPANLGTQILRQLPGPINPSGSAWSASWWVYIDVDALDNGFHWSVYDGTTLKMSAAWGGTTEVNVRIAGVITTIALNEEITVSGWYHVVIVSKESVVQLFVNGVFQTDGLPVSQPAMSVPNLYVGGTRGTVAYNMPIDAFGFWNVALSDTEVTELYNAGDGWEPDVATATVEVVIGSQGRVNISGATQVAIGGNVVFPNG